MALFGLERDYSDPGVGEFGLENSVMALGDDFFEIVAPVVENTAVARALQRADADCCGYMVLFQVADFTAFSEHAQALNLRQIWSAQRPEVSACHIHPKDIGGAIVSFDEMRPAEEWVWAGPDWQQRRSSLVQGVRGLVLESENAEQDLAGQWSRVCQREAKASGTGLQIEFDEATYAEFNVGAQAAIRKFKLVSDNVDEVLDRAGKLDLPVVEAGVQLGDLILEFVEP